jgi:GTP-binding protein Era
MLEEADKDKKCGFVAIVGPPNAGKSTLVNALVENKVSIVSSKVQTTRTLVKGIYTEGACQIVFIDTPGVFDAQKKLERAIVAAAMEGPKEADAVMLVVDASSKRLERDVAGIINKLGALPNLILVLNKIDKVSREKLMAQSKSLNDLYSFDATFMISALKEDGTRDLLKYLSERMPAAAWFYPEDQVSDMPMRLLSAEITREKLFERLHHELPYYLTVETEEWENFENGDVKISQVIFVTRDSQKAIILGKGGRMIREIGERSRLELEEILEQKVHLKLFVKVRQNWLDDPERYEIWGLDHGQ